jgi:hypothetical protein
MNEVAKCRRDHNRLVADSFSPEMAETINRLLDIQPGETVSALQKIKADPAKSSAPAMNALMHKMAAIEATGILGIDLSWLNANYQRAMFHYVRKCTADRLRELAGPRRLATLTCFLRQSYRDTIDQACRAGRGRVAAGSRSAPRFQCHRETYAARRGAYGMSHLTLESISRQIVLRMNARSSFTAPP